MKLSLLYKSSNKYLIYFGDGLVLFLSFLVINISAFGANQFPDVNLFAGDGWEIARTCFYVFLIVFLLLFRNALYRRYMTALIKNWQLIVFLLYAFLSLFWTISIQATLYELLLLLFSTSVGIYFAIRYQILGMINVLTVIAAICTLTGLFLVFFTPYGVMPNEPFVGSWDGLFWHRNHTGSLMAFFNMVFLTRLLMEKTSLKAAKFAFVLFYLLTTLHVFGSRSAAGIIIFIVLNVSTIIAYVWLTWREKINIWHYYSFVIAILIMFVVFVLNLEFFFGLLGRSATMTGRTPLWIDLLQNFYLEKPIFGHGFGAIWMQENFRLLMQSRQGWKYPVYFSDNGFLDILLNLGAVGLLLFLLIFILVITRSIKMILSTYSWMSVFIFLTLIYVFFANIAYSFLFEVDYFVWMILVIMLTLTSIIEPQRIKVSD